MSSAPSSTAVPNPGFDAVEIDNLDTADRFPDIDRTCALELAAAYVDRAHAHGLSIAQKNALAEAGLDFADACTVPDRLPLMIQRDRDLVAAGDHGYRYDTC